MYRRSSTLSLTARLVATGLLCWALVGTAYAVLRLTFGERPVSIHVRWAPTIDAATRLQLEQRYRLTRAEPREDRTFGYALTDRSRDNIRNLVLDPAVEDTHEIDRTAFRAEDAAPRLPYVTPSPGYAGMAASYVPVVLGGLIALFGVASALAFGAALAQRMSMLDRLLAWLIRIGRRLLARKQWQILLLVVTVIGGCFFAARTMELKTDEQSHYTQFERYVAGDYVTTTSTAGGFEATAADFRPADGRLDEGGHPPLCSSDLGSDHAAVLVARAIIRAAGQHHADAPVRVLSPLVSFLVPDLHGRPTR